MFLVGLEENLFPSQMVLNSRTDLEEERRLFYVAITRAMKTCTLSYANSRFQWGNLITSEPSRFIDEIDEKYLNFEITQRGAGRSLTSGRSIGVGGFQRSGGLNKPLGDQGNLKPVDQVTGGKDTSSLDLKVGYNVEHDRFGKGKITKIDGQGADKKATIFFPHHGAKTVLLRFANLNVVD